MLLGKLGGKRSDQLHLCIATESIVSVCGLSPVKEASHGAPSCAPSQLSHATTVSLTSGTDPTYKVESRRDGRIRTDDILQRCLRVDAEALGNRLDPVWAERPLGVDESDCESERESETWWLQRKERTGTHPCLRRLPCRAGAGSSVPPGAPSVSQTVRRSRRDPTHDAKRVTELSLAGPELAVDCVDLLRSASFLSRARRIEAGRRTLSDAPRLHPAAEQGIERSASGGDEDDLLAAEGALGAGEERLRAERIGGGLDLVDLCEGCV